MKFSWLTRTAVSEEHKRNCAFAEEAMRLKGFPPPGWALVVASTPSGRETFLLYGADFFKDLARDIREIFALKRTPVISVLMAEGADLGDGDHLLLSVQVRP